MIMEETSKGKIGLAEKLSLRAKQHLPRKA
jgi:hypothetical protein